MLYVYVNTHLERNKETYLTLGLLCLLNIIFQAVLSQNNYYVCTNTNTLKLYIGNNIQK